MSDVQQLAEPDSPTHSAWQFANLGGFDIL
jgi:hypothetical protein